MDVISREVRSNHERQSDASSAVLFIDDGDDAGTDWSVLRRQVERHLDVQDAVVTQLTVNEFLVDVFRQIDLADHGLLEDGALSVLETLRH